jgi:hypothetical protein
MNRPGSKYFKGRLVGRERVLQYVIWDGVRDFQNVPPQALALTEKMQGLQLYVQVDADSVDDIREVIVGPYRACPEAGGLVVWTRDHRTYRRIVRRLMGDAAWLQ